LTNPSQNMVRVYCNPDTLKFYGVADDTRPNTPRTALRCRAVKPVSDRNGQGGFGGRRMIRIAVGPAAFNTIAATLLPLGSVGFVAFTFGG
jgi:hypothetical protein